MKEQNLQISRDFMDNINSRYIKFHGPSHGWKHEEVLNN